MKVVILMAVLLLTGCAHRKPKSEPESWIPIRCMHKLTRSDFNGPCTQVGEAEASCNDVRIHFDCVDAPK